MREKARKALEELIARKDASIFHDATKFEKSLEELLGGITTEIIALKSALIEKLPWDLRRIPNNHLSFGDMKRFAENLSSKYNISYELAQWAVESWAVSIGMTVDVFHHNVKGRSQSDEKLPIIQSSRAGFIYGIDDKGIIKIFQVWYSPTKTENKPLNFATWEKSEIAAERPFFHENSTKKLQSNNIPKNTLRFPTTSSRSSSSAVSSMQIKQHDSSSVATKETTTQQQSSIVKSLPKNSSSSVAAPVSVTGFPLQALKLRSYGAQADSLYSEGMAYLTGQNGKIDVNEALKAFQRASELGHLGAEYRIGEILLQGRGVKENIPAAVKWFRSAAEKGLAEAQIQLGTLFQIGLGVDADLVEAQKWFKKAAEQGHPEAQLLLQQTMEFYK